MNDPAVYNPALNYLVMGGHLPLSALIIRLSQRSEEDLNLNKELQLCTAMEEVSHLSLGTLPL